MLHDVSGAPVIACCALAACVFVSLELPFKLRGFRNQLSMSKAKWTRQRLSAGNVDFALVPRASIGIE